MSEPITNVEDAVAVLGALPVPQGPEPRTLEQVEHELDGANLSLYEEELLTARLRLALASAQRGRRELRARVAALLAERHVTNEALDDVVGELRTSYAERARRETHPGRRQAWRMLAQIEESERVADALLTPETARSADRLTRPFAPTQALREGDEFGLHHDYRVGRDLPEAGGSR